MGDYMKLINDVRNFIVDNEFQIVVKNNFVDIQNFDLIDTINESTVIVTKEKRKIKIKGKSLTVNKLLSDELSIKGKILEITFEGINE